MSAELSALEALANDNLPAWFYLSSTAQAVLFYATPYLTKRENWIDRTNPTDTVSDTDWDTIEAYVDELLYEAKNPMIGYIFPMVVSVPPPNVLVCDGSTYLRVDFPNLYDVLDSFFIVDGDHFKVPDLRGRTIIGVGDGLGLTTRNVGDTGGEEEHQLTESELASHAHTIPFTIDVPVVAPGEVVTDAPVPFTSTYTGSAGGDVPHNNMQPFFSLNYGIIAS